MERRGKWSTEESEDPFLPKHCGGGGVLVKIICDNLSELVRYSDHRTRDIMYRQIQHIRYWCQKCIPRSSKVHMNKRVRRGLKLDLGLSGGI